MTAAVVLASVAFWAPVNYTIVGDDAKPETIQGRARFKRLKTSERLQLDARFASNRMDAEVRKVLRARLDDPETKLTRKIRAQMEANLAAEPIDDDEFLSQMLVDLELKDKQGQAVMYTPAKLAELCEEWDGFETALVAAYFTARREALDPKAVEKNSGEPSGTGS